MILTSNRGFSEWAEIFGDAVVATALLDRLLHHAVVITIEGNSYRLREHADLVPEHLRSRPLPKVIDLPEDPRIRHPEVPNISSGFQWRSGPECGRNIRQMRQNYRNVLCTSVLSIEWLTSTPRIVIPVLECSKQKRGNPMRDPH